jgi:hypothetical protein
MKHPLLIGISIAATLGALALASCQPKAPAAPTPMPASKSDHAAVPGKKDLAESRAAFLAAYPVFMHPRCMNCHPSGDAPLQGDDSHTHTQNVKRGPDGNGLYALKCSNCHQATNLAGANMPPGNPVWHLPPESMKMIFQGRTPAELAAQLKDPAQNGGKTLDQIVHHVTDDKLVAGCWNPGDGRVPPPIPHNEFASHVREWVEKGAAIPN